MAHVSAVLDGMVKRIYEVIDVQVQGGASLSGPLGVRGRRSAGRIIQLGGRADSPLVHPSSKFKL